MWDYQPWSVVGLVEQVEGQSVIPLFSWFSSGDRVSYGYVGVLRHRRYPCIAWYCGVHSVCILSLASDRILIPFLENMGLVFTLIAASTATSSSSDCLIQREEIFDPSS